MKGRRSSSMQGLTLIECLASLAICAVVLGGLSHILSVALATYKTAHTIYQNRADAHVAMARIVDAIHVAGRKEKGVLSAKALTTSGDWFYGITSDGKSRKITYSWSKMPGALHGALNESDDINHVNQAILGNVTDFSVTDPPTNGETLITVSLTVGGGDEAVRLTETVRLGGAR